MMSMPVAQMYGVDAGPVETHYGNNVPMTPGSGLHDHQHTERPNGNLHSDCARLERV